MKIIKEVEWEDVQYRKFSDKTWEKEISNGVWEPTPRIRILEMLPDMLIIKRIGDQIINQILSQHSSCESCKEPTLKKQKEG